MKELDLLKQWVGESKKHIKSPEAMILKTIDDSDIAIKSIPSLLNLYATTLPMTSVAGAIGTKLLSGIETEILIEGIKDKSTGHQITTYPENIMRKQRVQCGLVIIRTLIQHNILSYFRERDNEQNQGRQQYMLSADNVPFIEALWLSVDITGLNHYSLPCKNIPLERHSFRCEEGGALVTNTPAKFFREYGYHKMPIVYDNINKLQNVGFEINNPLLDIANDSRTKSLPIMNFNDKMNLGNDEYISLQRDSNVTLGIANSFRHIDTFYYYWRLCFRGRYYCSASYLQPQGGKMSKSLLKLKDAKELGEKGWYWLLVHLANTAGYDKLPIKERYQVALDHLDEWLIWADDPYDRNFEYTYYNRKNVEVTQMVPEWTQMDDAWNFLAAILEVKAAIDSGDRYTYKSGLMIGFDATTSGLQIMSLLTRDEETGALCNITLSDIVGDSYKYIMDNVYKKLRKSKNPLSKYWLQYYDKRRGIGKTPVMVYVYSCKSQSMADHIYNEQRTKLLGITQEHCDLLGQLIYNSCRRLLKGPSQVMDLFIAIGLEWAKFGEDYKLTLPFNEFPLLQYYREDVSDKIIFKMDGKRIRLRYISDKSNRIDEQKVRQAIAPNIVHGLDSQIPSWLLSNTDYDMVPVHDCFYCCPSDADSLFDDVRAGTYEIFKPNVLQSIIDDAQASNLKEAKEITMGDDKMVDAVLYNEICFS